MKKLIILLCLFVCSCSSFPDYFDYMQAHGKKVNEPDVPYILMTVSRNIKHNGTMIPAGPPVEHGLRLLPGDSINYAGTCKFNHKILSAKLFIGNEFVWDWTNEQEENGKSIGLFLGTTVVPEELGRHDLLMMITLMNGEVHKKSVLITVWSREELER